MTTSTDMEAEPKPPQSCDSEGQSHPLGDSGSVSGASPCSAWKAINDDALDGQMRILSDGERVMTGAWEETAWGGMAWFSEDSKVLPMQPTMWMPLPNPPKQNERAEERE